MAFTQAQLDALDAAIAGGELTVKYQDKQVTYRSLDEMIRTRQLIKADLDEQNGVPRPLAVYASTSKGTV